MKSLNENRLRFSFLYVFLMSTFIDFIGQNFQEQTQNEVKISEY